MHTGDLYDWNEENNDHDERKREWKFLGERRVAGWCSKGANEGRCI